MSHRWTGRRRTLPCTNCETPLCWATRGRRAVTLGNVFALAGCVLAVPVFWPALRDGTDIDHPLQWPMLACLTVAAVLLLWGVGWGLTVEALRDGADHDA